ncbi:MAG: hypothetical protein IPM79_04485 [Polyangiaceae bacterium]|nr:hypothetical protein [Polyangiaceae bacterium]MBK8936908.1 hypothetical protein [Polyangiaceae bacterium]
MEVGFIVFVAEPSRGEEIAGEVRRMRTLGMSLRAIGRALAVDEKTVRKLLVLRS